MTSTLRRASSRGLLAVGLVSCLPGRGSDALAGACFTIEVAWPELARHDSLELVPPPRVRLDTTRVSGGAGPFFRVVEMEGSLPSIHRFASWRLLPPDSVEMAWSTGFASVRLRLLVHGDTLRGTARSGYDVGEGSEASAMAVRVSCSAPVPSDQRRRHASPLSVPLLTGEGRLQVGASAEPCPDVSARAVGGWCPVEGEAAGPYAGADSLAVYVERGRGIRAIRLTYLDARTLPAVLEGMRAAFGPEDAGSARVRPGGPAWIDRERWIAVREDPAAGAFVVLVADPKWAW